jgi:hypothetical protein
MKIAVVLRWAAVAVGVSGAIFWVACGANRGWSKTSVPIHKKDPVTDQDYIEWQKKFVPGVEFIAADVGVAVVLFGVSFFTRGTIGAARSSINQV